MRPEEARAVLWVRTVEETDAAGEVLSPDERRRGSEQAGVGEDGRGSGEVLARRAAILCEQLRKDGKREWGEVPESGNAFRWGLFALGVPVGAFLLGVLAHRLGNTGMVNVIALPFLGIVAFNLLVYVFLFGWWVKGVVRRGAGGAHPFMAGVAGFLTGKAGEEINAESGLEKARGGFLRTWRRLTEAMDVERVAVVLHVSAACLALGVIGGMYLDGFVKYYKAVWESTFLDAGQVQGLMNVVMGPAQAVSGISSEVTEAMDRGRLGKEAGVNAAEWIHLSAISLLIFVVVPRLGLALGAKVMAGKEWGRGVDGLGFDSYRKKLVRRMGSGVVRVACVSYGRELEAVVRDRLFAAFADVWGAGMIVDRKDVVKYGDEEEYAEAFAKGEMPEAVVVVYPMTATPEEETHGELFSELVKVCPPDEGRPSVYALVRGDKFAEKFGELQEFEKRKGERREAWKRVLAAVGAPVVFWDGKVEDGVGLAEELVAVRKGEVMVS